MTTVLRELGRSVNRAWENLAEGWRQLFRSSRDALTHYVPAKGEEPAVQAGWEGPVWGLLPGEIKETRKSVVVELELPGIDRDDVDVEVVDGNLVIRGEKHFDREHVAESYYLMERAYGYLRLLPARHSAAIQREHERAQGLLPRWRSDRRVSENRFTRLAPDCGPIGLEISTWAALFAPSWRYCLSWRKDSGDGRHGVRAG